MEHVMAGMRSVKMAAGMAGVMALVLAAGSAVGQVAPPPTPAPAKTPEFTPPPAEKPATPVAPPAKAETPQRPDTSAEPPTDIRMIKERLKSGSIKMPEGFDDKVLVRRGPDGKLVKFDKPLAWVTVEENPLVTPKEHEALATWMSRRQLSHELGLVNNLDLALKVDAGEFDRLDPRDRRQLSWASNTQKQLRTAGMVSEWLFLRKAVTEEQAAAIQLIGDAYGRAKLEEVRKEAGEDHLAASTAITREMYKQWVEEPMFVFHGLLERAAENIEVCVQGAEIPTEMIELIRPEMEAAKKAGSPQDKRAAMTALLQKLPDWVEQHKILDAAVTIKFPDRSGTMNGLVVKPVMAYQIEEKRRMDKAAAGKEVQIRKAPERPK